MQSEVIFIVYELSYVTKMLPYIRSFCRSFVKHVIEVTAIMNDHSLSRSDLEHLMSIKTAIRTNWLMEMQPLGFKICNEVRGLISVPLIHPHSRELVSACIDYETKTEQDVLCHRLNEKCSCRRSIWKL